MLMSVTGLVLLAYLLSEHFHGGTAANVVVTPPQPATAVSPPALLPPAPTAEQFTVTTVNRPVRGYGRLATWATIVDLSADQQQYLAIKSESNRKRGTGSIDTLLLYDLKSTTSVKTLTGPEDRDEYSFDIAALSPDGKRVATGSFYGWVRVRDTANGSEIAAWRENFKLIEAMAFSPDGKMLATASSSDMGQEHFIYVYDAVSLKKLFTLSRHDDDITHLLFTADSKSLISSSRDYTIKVWDISAAQK